MDEKLLFQIQEAVEKTLLDATLTLSDAKQLIARAEEKASSMQLPVVICIVDQGGNLIAQHKMDDALLASIQLSYAKAYTAIALKTPTHKLAPSILPGQSLYGLQNTHPNFCLFPGGLPIKRHGKWIGAIGVSGGTTDEDQLIASYAIEGIS